MLQKVHNEMLDIICILQKAYDDLLRKSSGRHNDQVMEAKRIFQANTFENLPSDIENKGREILDVLYSETYLF